MSDFNPLETIDHLVEFGMSMAVAQQIIITMNHCMENMKIAGTGSSMRQSVSPNQYHIVIDNSISGPFSPTELEVLVKAKTVTPHTLMWKPGMTGWTKAVAIPEIYKIIMLNS